jgi:hypothetical protein
MDIVTELRGSPRYRVMKPGIISFNGSGIKCLVCNVSDTGAALEVSGKISIPDAFNLTIASEMLDKSCRVVWRKYQRVGVAFY